MPGTDLKNLTRDQIAFGQSIAVTGIQEVAALAGLVNGGVYHPPTLIKSATTSDGQPVARCRPRQPRRIVSAETSKVIRDLMGAVVDSAERARISALAGLPERGQDRHRAAGDPACGCYQGYVTSYAGFAPLDDPQLLTYVVLEQPAEGRHRHRVAAPVFRDIMAFALPRYSVPPNLQADQAEADHVG